MEADVSLTTPVGWGDAPLPRRNGYRGMIPLSWLGRELTVEVAGSAESYRCTLLDFCGLGLVVNLNQTRAIVPWERISLVELGSD